MEESWCSPRTGTTRSAGRRTSSSRIGSTELQPRMSVRGAWQSLYAPADPHYSPAPLFLTTTLDISTDSHFERALMDPKGLG